MFVVKGEPDTSVPLGQGSSITPPPEFETLCWKLGSHSD